MDNFEQEQFHADPKIISSSDEKKFSYKWIWISVSVFLVIIISTIAYFLLVNKKSPTAQSAQYPQSYLEKMNQEKPISNSNGVTNIFVNSELQKEVKGEVSVLFSSQEGLGAKVYINKFNLEKQSKEQLDIAIKTTAISFSNFRASRDGKLLARSTFKKIEYANSNELGKFIPIIDIGNASDLERIETIFWSYDNTKLVYSVVDHSQANQIEKSYFIVDKNGKNNKLIKKIIKKYVPYDFDLQLLGINRQSTFIYILKKEFIASKPYSYNLYTVLAVDINSGEEKDIFEERYPAMKFNADFTKVYFVTDPDQEKEFDNELNEYDLNIGTKSAILKQTYDSSFPQGYRTAFGNFHIFPDENHIAFTERISRGLNDFGINTFILEKKTNKLTVLIEDVSGEQPEIQSISPDGNYIAFLKSNGEFIIMDIRTKKITSLGGSDPKNYTVFFLDWIVE